VQVCKSPIHRCSRAADRFERYEEEQVARENRRVVKNVTERWPRHSLRSSSLSRSLTGNSTTYNSLFVQPTYQLAKKKDIHSLLNDHNIEGSD